MPECPNHENGMFWDMEVSERLVGFFGASYYDLDAWENPMNPRVTGPYIPSTGFGSTNVRGRESQFPSSSPEQGHVQRHGDYSTVNPMSPYGYTSSFQTDTYPAQRHGDYSPFSPSTGGPGISELSGAFQDHRQPTQTPGRSYTGLFQNPRQPTQVPGGFYTSSFQDPRQLGQVQGGWSTSRAQAVSTSARRLFCWSISGTKAANTGTRRIFSLESESLP